jgi:arginase
MRAIHLIGVPLDLGAGRRGVDMGPSAVRVAGLAGRIAALGHPVVDRGDLAIPSRELADEGDRGKKYAGAIASVCQTLRDLSVAALDEGGLPLVLGGDHSLAAGSVAASAERARRAGQPLGLVWIDAHGDMNTPASSPTGNVHGMPLAALLGVEPVELSGVGGFAPKVRPEHTVLVGVRNLDEREKVLVRESRVHVFTMQDIDRAGMASVAADVIALASRGTAGVHVSFDLDACDPTIAPGVGTPVKGGLDYREAHLLMELVSDSGRLVALDMVEVNPTLDVRNATAVLATELALSALGMKIL